MPETAVVPTHVLTKHAVRWGVNTLGAQPIHPTFLLYLYLRTKHRAGSLASASPSDETLLSLMRLPGHATKPYYFPLVDRAKDRNDPMPQSWRAENIPGNWSPGSIRPESPGGWLLGPSGTYQWPDDHVDRAFQRMLYGKPVSALSLGAYFLRNDGFVISGEATADDVIAGFRDRFDFPTDADGEFTKLFSIEIPDVTFDWFELVASMAATPEETSGV